MTVYLKVLSSAWSFLENLVLLYFIKEKNSEIFLRFYKTPCKSVFLLQIKYIEKFKLLWQFKIGEGGGRKIILLCDERKQGAVPQKN